MPAHQIVAAGCTVQLLRGDITRIPVDAIVNAANAALAGGGGVDGAIHSAGGPQIMEELRQYDGCPTGSAVVTGAGCLPARFVFHAVGPVYRGGNYGEPDLLASCYKTALQLAHEYNCQSISFPSISTGIYGYPLADAAAIALSTITTTLDSLSSMLRLINLVQFNDASYNIYRDLMDNFTAHHATAQTSYD